MLNSSSSGSESDALLKIILDSADDSSDLDYDQTNAKQVRKKRRPNKERDFDMGFQRIWNDVFSANPVYSDSDFLRCFRMPRELFNKILKDISVHNPFFTRKKDALGKLGSHPLQKAVAD